MIAVTIGLAALLAAAGSATAGASSAAAVVHADSAATAGADTARAAGPDSTSVARAAHPRLADEAVVRLNRDGGLARLSPDTGRPVDPQGIAFDSFGRVYVTDRELRRLLRYQPSGQVDWEAGSLGDDAGRLRRPGAIANAGVLAMAVLDEENRTVPVYDLFGRFQSVRIDLDAALDAQGGGRSRPVGLASDRGGTLYVADAEQDRILVVDPSGTLTRTIAGHGAGPGSFHGIAGITVSRHGDLFVTERVDGRVQRLDASGAPRASWRLPEAPQGERLPVAVDDSMRVAIADPAGGVVWLFDASGRYLGEARGLLEPVALGFARDGSLWVAERRARRLSRFVLEFLAERTVPDKD